MAAEKLRWVIGVTKQVAYDLLKLLIPLGALIMISDALKLTAIGVLPKLMRASGLDALKIACIVIGAYAVRQLVKKK